MKLCLQGDNKELSEHENVVLFVALHSIVNELHSGFIHQSLVSLVPVSQCPGFNTSGYT